MINAPGRFLVIDDEEVVRRSYDRVLSDAGYEVETASNGAAALDAIGQGHYDAVFADLKMPDMHGLEVTRLLRLGYPQLPVVIITGYPSYETELEAAQLGVLEYVAKPVDPKRLTELAGAALEASGVGHATPVDVGTRSEVAETEEETPARTHAVEEEATDGDAREPGLAKSLLLLATAPFIGGFYVLLMPLIGFGVLIALGAKALGWRRDPSPGRSS